MGLPPDARHSPDFCSLLWNGVSVSFTPMQAAIVQMLWKALDNGTPEVHGSTLLAEAESQIKENRLDPLFFRHMAWKTLIVRGQRRGTYRLNHRAFLDDARDATPVSAMLPAGKLTRFGGSTLGDSTETNGQPTMPEAHAPEPDAGSSPARNGDGSMPEQPQRNRGNAGTHATAATEGLARTVLRRFDIRDAQ